jgi:hypothetical protein
MRPLATDTHDFPSIRKDGKIYVDEYDAPVGHCLDDIPDGVLQSVCNQ